MKKDKPDNRQEALSLKKRFSYWFDNKMAKGSFVLILVLVAFSILLAVLIAGLIILLGFNSEGETVSVIWDGIATVINAWMPSFADGGPGYLLLMALIAIAGLLFTSVLIGIITSAIEVKITDLKKGNSLVLEQDHIVMLGFYPGEYALINQLILAAAGKPDCIVVAEDMEREEMEQAIKDNIGVPKNIRIVCRTVDITDPSSIDKCSVETCRTIIVSPTDDMKTIKAVLAVSNLLAEKGVPEIGVNAIISKPEYRFPPSLAEANNITTLQTSSVLAKIIAHSCTQTGLSGCFQEILNFEGAEFYLNDITGIDGLSFGELATRLDGAVPVGILREGKIIMNPPADFILLATDRILVFSEERDAAMLVDGAVEPLHDRDVLPVSAEAPTHAVVIGYNETLPVILKELPTNVSRVFLVGSPTTERDELQQTASARNLDLHFLDENTRSESTLVKLARLAEHVVILNDHDREPEEADMEVIFLLLNLRDTRKRYDLSFNITVEMRKESNQRLVGGEGYTDFIVSSRMSSLILAQLAENPELIDVFREILSNEGNEIYIKRAGNLNLVGKYKVRELRRILLNQGYILLGRMNDEAISQYNPSLREEILLTENDSLIVLGED